jgi:hypothetical protein
MAAIVTKPSWQLCLAILLILICINLVFGVIPAVVITIMYGVTGVLALLGI